MTISKLGDIIIASVRNTIIIQPSVGSVNRLPIRKFKVKPIQLGTYSRGVLLPAWWFKLSQKPKELESGITIDFMEIAVSCEEAQEEGVGSGK